MYQRESTLPARLVAPVLLAMMLLATVLLAWSEAREHHCWAWDGAEPEYYRYDVPGCDGP